MNRCWMRYLSQKQKIHHILFVAQDGREFRCSPPSIELGGGLEEITAASYRHGFTMQRAEDRGVGWAYSDERCAPLSLALYLLFLGSPHHQ